MAREIIIAGNWKMNLLPDQAWDLVEGLKDQLKPQSGLKVVVVPQAPLLPLVSGWLDGSFIEVGSQNSSEHLSGAFTGEVSPQLLRQLGVAWGLAGHSERRELFHETDAQVAAKADLLIQPNLTPIVCVGETLSEREAGGHLAKIANQVKAIYAQVPKEAAKHLVFAYEPIWAIGTGKTATAAQANEIHQMIRGVIAESTCEFIAQATPILYGGSVKPDNATEILTQPHVDGLLVGGASLKPQDFIQIVQAFDHL